MRLSRITCGLEYSLMTLFLCNIVITPLAIDGEESLLYWQQMGRNHCIVTCAVLFSKELKPSDVLLKSSFMTSFQIFVVICLWYKQQRTCQNSNGLSYNFLIFIYSRVLMKMCSMICIIDIRDCSMFHTNLDFDRL